MKKLLLLSLICFSFASYAQLTNFGFESWYNGIPYNWVTSNIPNQVTNVTMSTTAHTGNYSCRGEVVSYVGQNYPPLLQAGAGYGIGVSQRYASVSGYYKFNSVGGDYFFVYAFLFNGADIIAQATIKIGASSSDWTPFSSDFVYNSEAVPFNCAIQFHIIGAASDGAVNLGSYFLLDDVSLDGNVNGINDHNNKPLAFSLGQNYPNPFNPSTTINYTLPEKSFASLTIYNQIGEKVDQLFSGIKEAGSYNIVWNASKLSSGVYFYELKTDNVREIKKLLLLK